ncbi:MAG: hypothetical protein AAFU33_28210 [Bacteroidota bacterium]
MSKKDLDFGKLDLGQKKPIKRIPTPSEKTETAVNSIHQSKPQERIKRITIDFPISTYKEIRAKTVEDEITLKEYFTRLVERDLEG